MRGKLPVKIYLEFANRITPADAGKTLKLQELKLP